MLLLEEYTAEIQCLFTIRIWHGWAAGSLFPMLTPQILQLCSSPSQAGCSCFKPVLLKHCWGSGRERAAHTARTSWFQFLHRAPEFFTRNSLIQIENKFRSLFANCSSVHYDFYELFIPWNCPAHIFYVYGNFFLRWVRYSLLNPSGQSFFHSRFSAIERAFHRKVKE